MLNKFVSVYLDNILIFSPDLESHQNHVRQVLVRLLENQISSRSEKGEVHSQTVSFLGYIIFEGEIKMAVTRPTLVSHNDVRFLGVANFYRKAEEEEAFQWLKKCFTSAPLLSHPDSVLQFMVEVDASDSGFGALLLQHNPKNGYLHPCAFLSKKLSPVEKNYDIRNWQ